MYVNWVKWLECSEEGEKASQALRRALKDYNLKFSVILSDPDLAPFRAMPEFRKLQEEVMIPSLYSVEHELGKKSNS